MSLGFSTATWRLISMRLSLRVRYRRGVMGSSIRGCGGRLLLRSRCLRFSRKVRFGTFSVNVLLWRRLGILTLSCFWGPAPKLRILPLSWSTVLEDRCGPTSRICKWHSLGRKEEGWRLKLPRGFTISTPVILQFFTGISKVSIFYWIRVGESNWLTLDGLRGWTII